MKLATIKDGTRDGQLAVVSRDLKSAQLADGIAPTLQRALDDWSFIAPQLQQLYQELNAGRGRRSFDFDPANCMAPLPRAYQWADGSAYVNHVELVRKARKAELPASFWDEPLMYQGGSDDFLGPHDDIALFHEEWGIDFEAEVAVITDDVPMGATPDQAHQQIRLLLLANDVSLRNLIPDELRVSALCKPSRPPAFRRWRSRPTNSTMRGRAARCTCRCARHGTASWSVSRTPASTWSSTFLSWWRTWPSRAMCGPVPSSARARCRTRTPSAAIPASPKNAAWK